MCGCAGETEFFGKDYRIAVKTKLDTWIHGDSCISRIQPPGSASLKYSRENAKSYQGVDGTTDK